MSSSTWIGGLILALGLWISPVMADEHGSAVVQQLTERGTDGCLKCHSSESNNPVVSVLHTPHFMAGDPNAPVSDKGCEGCHGASSEHAKKLAEEKEHLRVPPEVNWGPKMAKSSIESRNTACLSCHEKGIVINWAGSAHDTDDVACSDCHSSHLQRDPSLDKYSEADVCFACHKTEQIEANKPSHHPMREGKVTCSDCHNPHGSVGPASVLDATINDTCYRCHAEKRGPFLWEHQPVAEDCTNCHFAHGSTNERLLKVARPFICQQCHTANHHQSSIYDGDDVAITVTDTDIARQLTSKACTNCHSQVHGSNHPSGVRRTR